MARLTLEFQSKYLLRKTEVVCYIPTMNLGQTMQNQSKNPYQESDKKLPLMILLGGFSESKLAWEMHSHVEDLADEYQIALVMVGGENKWYLNASPIDGWYDFLNTELPDFLYGNFKALSSDAPLYICGESMGGYGALRHYLTNLDKYKACCALSPAIKPDGNLEEMLHLKNLKELFVETKDAKKNIYLSVGTKDFIYNASKEFDDFLTSENVGVNYHFIEGYEHNWKLWREEIVKFFEYIKGLE